MPDEIDNAQALQAMPLSVSKNVVRGFSLVHDPEGSHYQNVEGNGDNWGGRSGKISNVIVRFFRLVTARHEVAKQSLQA